MRTQVGAGRRVVVCGIQWRFRFISRVLGRSVRSASAQMPPCGTGRPATARRAGSKDKILGIALLLGLSAVFLATTLNPAVASTGIAAPSAPIIGPWRYVGGNCSGNTGGIYSSAGAAEAAAAHFWGTADSSPQCPPYYVSGSGTWVPPPSQPEPPVRRPLPALPIHTMATATGSGGAWVV